MNSLPRFISMKSCVLSEALRASHAGGFVQTPVGLMLHACIALALLATCFSGPAWAQSVPSLVNYQGRLANPDGSPLPTADYMLTFNLYDAATNGALVWGPQVFDGAVAAGHGARIPVVQGYFNVMLGPVDASGSPRPLADAFNGASRYVEVTVSNRPPIAPRQQILTTPFAFQAANSAKLAGFDWSAVFGTNDPVNGKISGSKLANGTVTAQQIANGTITIQQLASTLATNQLWSIGGSPGSIFYNAGPVGIGTTNPIGSFQVAGIQTIGGIGQAGSLRIYSDAASGNGSWGEFFPDNTRPGRTVFEGGNGTASVENSLQISAHLLGADNVHSIGTATNRWNSIRIGTGNGIFEGNVAIGKTNPTTRLDVNGTVTATAFSGSGAGVTSLNGANISDGTIAFSKFAPRQVGTNVGLGGFAASATITTNLFGGTTNTVTIKLTVGSGLVFVGLAGPPGPTADQPSIGNSLVVELLRDGVLLLNLVSPTMSTAWSFDASSGPGDHNYSVRLSKMGGGDGSIINVRLIAFEL